VKTCTQCGVLKPLNQFPKNRYHNDGYQSYCRVCKQTDYKRYSQTPGGKAVRSRASARYHQTDNGRRHHRETQRRQRLLHPSRTVAHNKLRWAIESGQITPPGVCSRCGHRGSVEAHHPDYAKPLEVAWLCMPCHKQTHKEMLARMEEVDGKEGQGLVGN
jgi:hypothetical protein